jgi:hypothetical protein
MPTPSIQLIVDFPADFDEEYLTLSHCWGGAEGVLKLTTATIPDFTKAIDIAALPKTFRHAIDATRRLGIRYLWIDSLCIIQDSSADWEAESARMHEVYSNATCNLAAHSGKNSHGGLFFRRRPEYSVFQRPFHMYHKLATESSFTSTQLVNGWWHLSKFDDSPLLTRGWVMQERYLARRTLYFADNEIYWECRSQMASEARPHDCAGATPP